MQLYTFDVFLCWSPCWVDRWESLEGSGPQGNCSDFHHFPSYFFLRLGMHTSCMWSWRQRLRRRLELPRERGFGYPSLVILGPHFSHLGLRSHTDFSMIWLLLWLRWIQDERFALFLKWFAESVEVDMVWLVWYGMHHAPDYSQSSLSFVNWHLPHTDLQFL